jgi:hypothetical protein
MAVSVSSAGLTACSGDDRVPLLDSLGSVRTGLGCDEVVDATTAQLTAVLDAGMRSSMAVREDLATTGAEAAPAGAPTTVAATALPDTGDAGSLGAGTAAGSVVAGTNVQEVGVDEADLVKTDGRRIVTVLDGVLRVVALDGTPALDGVVDLGLAGAGDAQLFLRGDEALAVATAYGPVAAPGGDTSGTGSAGTGSSPASGAAEPMVPEATGLAEAGTAPTAAPPTTVPPLPVPFSQAVVMARVDLSDAAAPRVVERAQVEGSLVAARMVDGTARVVVRSDPAVVPLMWQADDAAAAEELLDDLSAEDVLPRMADDTGQVRSLGGCGDVAVLPAVTDAEALTARATVAPTPTPSTVSVLTVGDTLADLAPVSVEGMADVVYASPTALWVTSTDWSGSGPATAVHRFATDDGPARYTGSGRVPGTVLDQYSLSESAGDLRVVTTTEDLGAAVPETAVPETGTEDVPAASPDEPVASPDDGTVSSDDPVLTTIIGTSPPVPSSAGRLTVLRPGDDGALAEIGHVDDLGRGERVQSVRYVGDLAYVVTFRQTDPLYAIDLSDPVSPQVLGELKVTGFSQYLHPVGDDLLVGLGREATAEGIDTGLKLSLFDVSDPTSPVELDKVVVPDGWSAAADDPHAFTWDPVGRNVIVPVSHSGATTAGGADVAVEPAAPEATSGQGVPGIAVQQWAPSEGALVVHAGDGSLEEVAELRHDGAATGAPWDAAILRSLVVDRDLWTLSRLGLGLSDADSPAEPALVSF